MSNDKWTDPIVEEVHQIRREIAAEFGNDLDACFRHIRERQEEARKSGRAIISPPPRAKKASDKPAA